MMQFKYLDCDLEHNGFIGHLVIPSEYKRIGIIVLSGGEKSLLPGKKIAEEFARYNYLTMSVPLFGCKGLKKSDSEIPLELVINSINFLKQYNNIDKVVLYGMSLGSIFAILASNYIQVDGVISVSGTHVIMEGESGYKKVSGHSIVTYNNKELPYMSYDMRNGIYNGFYGAYQKNNDEYILPIEKSNCPLLLLASKSDEEWPSDISVNILEKRLIQYKYPYKVVVYEKGSHLMGMLPRDLYGRILLKVGKLFFMSLRKYPNECIDTINKSKNEILNFLSSIEEGE